MDTPTLPSGMTADQVANAVRQRYSQVADDPEGEYTFRVGRAFAEALGYPAELLDNLPAGAIQAFTGVATPSLLPDAGAGGHRRALWGRAGPDFVVVWGQCRA